MKVFSKTGNNSGRIYLGDLAVTEEPPEQLLRLAYSFSFHVPKNMRTVEILDDDKMILIQEKTLHNQVIPISFFLKSLRDCVLHYPRLVTMIEEMSEGRSSFLENPLHFMQRLKTSLRKQKRMTLLTSRDFGDARKRIDKRAALAEDALMTLQNTAHSLKVYPLPQKSLYKVPTDQSSKVKEQYRLGPYEITISDTGSLESLYEVTPFSQHLPIKLSMKYLARRVVKLDRRFYAERFVNMKLDEAINHRQSTLKRIVPLCCADFKKKLSREELGRLIALSSFRSLNIHLIMPFLLDEKITEIFQDRPRASVYLDHSTHGRCISNTRLGQRSLSAFTTHVKIDTGVVLDEETASLKTDYKTRFFNIRVSIDRPPLAFDGFSIDIRRFRQRPLTLSELIANNTLSPEAASFLLLAAIFRMNILIAGEPGSGKTTLMNAIDLLLPSFLRKVYIEDAVESIPQYRFDHHQLRLKVETLESRDRSKGKDGGKMLEIAKMLHRKPDYIILGELQTKKDFIAVFFAVSSGLRTLQTCHAETLSQLFTRIIDVYGIHPSLLANLDLILFMRRYVFLKEQRKLHAIYETGVERPPASTKPRTTPIFLFKEDAGVALPTLNIHETRILRKISENERIPVYKIIRLYDSLRNFLASSSKPKIYDTEYCVWQVNKIIGDIIEQ